MAKSKGLYNVGKSHAEGGIPAVNVDTGQHIEVELNEYKICNSAYSSDKILSYSNKTNKEILDDIHDNFSCEFDKNQVKNGEFILCKVVVLDPAKRSRKGTVKQILDQMQSEKSCNVSQGSDTLSLGGKVGAKNKKVEIILDGQNQERFEISDRNAKLDEIKLLRFCKESLRINDKIDTFVKDILPFWDGYEFYPDIKDVVIVFLPSFVFKNSAIIYIPQKDIISINSEKIINEYGRQRKTNNETQGQVGGILGRRSSINSRRLGNSGSRVGQSLRGQFFHEIQHAIQKREGIEISISSPTYILKQLKEINGKQDLSDKDFIDYIEKKEGREYKFIEYDFYKNLPSEKEAIQVEKRSFYTKEELKEKPFEFKKGGFIPTEKYIYLGKEGGSNVSGQGMFDKAVLMDRIGVDTEIIRKQTGWFLNKFDNLWRYEISDESAEIDYDYLEKALDFVLKSTDGKNKSLRLNKLYKNELLSKAYPTIGNIKVLFSKDLKVPAHVVTIVGSATNQQDIYLEINTYEFKKRIFKHGLRGDGVSRTNGRATIKNILTHELQHVVQIREGLSGGSSTSREFEKLLEKRENGLLRPRKRGTGVYGNDAENIRYLNDLAKKNYLNHLGEIEARDSEARILFDKDTRIEIPPYALISFNNNDVIVELEDKIEFEDGGEINNLDNSEELNTFTKNSNNGKEDKKHVNRVEETRLVNESEEISITKKALELRRRIQEAQLDAEKRTPVHVDINRIIYDYCVSQNIWFDNTDEFGDFLCRGNENDVFLSDDKTTVYKINNLMNVGSVLGLFDKIDYHNEFFPETKYTFVGFFGHVFSKSIALSPVFSQEYIPDADYAAVIQIDDYMLKQGFVKIANFTYEKDDVKTLDIRPRNVLIQKDLSTYVIDAEFKEVMAKGGQISKSYKDKYNIKYGYKKGQSHSLEEISKDTGVSMEGLQQIYNKGIGAYKTNPESVRPNVKSKEQWAMARVYSAVMGGKAANIDSNELEMELGGEVLSGGLSDNKSIEDIAKMHNVSLDYAKSQLEKGIKAELEHTDNKEIAKEISLDHLYEKINYYIELDKMENKIDTSIQTNAFIETEVDNEPTLFDSVNAVRKFEYGGSITDIGNWDDVPNEWRNISKIAKSKFTPIPTDKGFQSFIKPFLGVDEINPRFLGVNYDEKNIVSTNGHILIVMPNTTDLKGILVTRDFRSGYKVGDSIDSQYVNYEAVIPVKAPYSYKIDCYKLYQFVSAAMNYANQTTYQIVLKYDTDKYIGFNAKLLLAALKSCIQLGYESIYIHLDSPNRAALLTPKKEYDASNVEEFLILVMPVLVNDEMLPFSATDLDFNRSLMVAYQLDTDQIVNADGSIAKFQMDYGKGELFNEKDVTLLNKIRPKKATLPILENIAVVNGDLIASDLSNTITIKQDKAKDGIYGVLNGVPYIDKSIDLDEFPIVKNDGKKKIFDVDTQFFKWIVSKALNFVGNDELRPAMTGLHLKKVTYGNGYRISVEATDAHILLKYDITDYVTDVDNEDFDVIINPKYLYAFCDYTEKETLEFSLSFSEKRAYFTDGKATLESRLIDERYPNIEQVIPFTSQNTFELNTIDIKDIVSSKVIKDFKKNPSQNSSGISVYGELTDDDKVIVYAVETESERSGYRSAQKVVRKEKIGEYDILYNVNAEEETDINVSLIMPIIVEEGISGNIIFSFNPKFLEEITVGVKSNKVKFGYTELNRAYIIQGEAMEYVPAKKNLVTKVAKEKEIIPEITPEPINIIESDDVVADNITDLFTDAHKNNSNKVEVIFNSAYNEEEHKDLPDELKESLKINKREVFDVVEEASDILSLVNNKDVKSIKYIKVDSAPTETTQPTLSEEIDNLKELLNYSEGDVRQALLEEIEGLEEMMKYDMGEGEMVDKPINVNQKKIDALLKRREKAEESLEKANNKETERFSRLGWGSGMRMGKLNVSYSKSDAVRERLKNIDKELESLGYAKMAQGGEINNAIMRELKSADVKTGQPISFYYSHAKNKQKTPNFGAKYGQNIEPHGKYIISVSESYGKLDDNDRTSYEYGVITFNNPLVLEHKSTDDKGWKKDLMDMFGGKKGSALSKEIIKKGYDGIITTDGKYVSEIVALNEFKMEQGGSTSIESEDPSKGYKYEPIITPID